MHLESSFLALVDIWGKTFLLRNMQMYFCTSCFSILMMRVLHVHHSDRHIRCLCISEDKLVSVVMNFEETFLCNSFGGSKFATSGSYGLMENLHWRLTDRIPSIDG